jgi:hypothetical protein
MKPHRHSCLATFLAVLLLVGPLGFAAPKPKGALIDLTKSKPDKTNNDYNLGPTGALGWMYVESGMTEEARQILITKVEKGSPADGKLEVGDVILGVFGQPFTTDARRTFGLAIGRAEAADGVLPLTVWRSNKTETVILQLQVMGAYSETSPYNCPKAAKILEQGLAVIAKNIGKDARFHINELALLASGKPEYLDLVRCGASPTTAACMPGGMATATFSSASITSRPATRACFQRFVPTPPRSRAGRGTSARGVMGMSHPPRTASCTVRSRRTVR